LKKENVLRCRGKEFSLLKKSYQALDIVIVFSIVFVFDIYARTDVSLSLDPVPNQVNAVRFDPSYYYDSPLKIDDMCAKLAAHWKKFAVNTIYFKIYDPIYGAKYKTSYDLNVVADYGKQDLLKHIIHACSKKNIKVFAWIPAFQHKAAWEAHPEWRVKLPDGTDYKPTEDSYFLCPANQGVSQWWFGFLEDLLKRYEKLDGIDIAEPIIRWKDNRCFCNFCAKADKNRGKGSTSSIGLTATLNKSIKIIHDFNKLACLTTVVSVYPDGRILSPQEQMKRTGFDLEGILEAENKPDWISLELMWQQWAADKNNFKNVFTPQWTQYAATTILTQIGGRTKVVGHLELTSFGNQKVDAEKLAESILAAKAAGIQHIDLYDTHLIDKENAWNVVSEAFQHIPIKNILVCYDSSGENDAKQVASLLSHFKTNVQLEQIQNDNHLNNKYFQQFNAVFCVVVDPNFILPSQFLAELATYDKTICWIQFGIDEFLKVAGEERYGFRFKSAHNDSAFNIVSYNGFSLPKIDPAYNIVSITDSSKCHQFASMSNSTETLPYALRSGDFWYFADLPTSFVVEGGRHIVFCDLLHEIVREDHQVRRLALVRIEDICPLTDIESIEQVADYLKSQDVPFSIALVPFYLDPESNTAIAMSDKPEFVDAIHYMIESGGTVVMHGSTHQYRGETTADYEFWDNMTGKPLFSDSKEYVRQRLLSGLAELGKNKIYPLAWETPHYGASQLDYSIINTFFSTSYERRQTIDMHGSDQLLPYLIYGLLTLLSKFLIH